MYVRVSLAERETAGRSITETLILNKTKIAYKLKLCLINLQPSIIVGMLN